MADISTNTPVGKDVDEKRSGSALLVLGMHRSGTSALTGALRLCGAWVGEEGELTGTNVENPKGFWERRDVRQVCDRLLHAAEADWWKVARFDPNAIPHAVLAEQRRTFGKIVSTLDEHGTWVVKEPRLCLLLPVLRDYVKDPVCIHIFRNPLEVARSLQLRNGFGLATGLALWETYNLRALSASEGLPRIAVSYEALMRHPAATLEKLVSRLEDFTVPNLEKPDDERVERFIDPRLYRQKATDAETEDYLSASQRDLWLRLCDGTFLDLRETPPISQVTKQHLFDLESTELSLNHHKDRTSRLTADVKKLEKEASRLTASLQRRNATIKTRERTIQKLTNTVEMRERRIGALEGEISRLKASLQRRNATISELHHSTSWKLTAPLRALSLRFGWLRRNLPRALRLLFWLSTGRFSRAFRAARSVLVKRAMKSIPRRDDQPLTDRLSKLIRQHREKQQSEDAPTALRTRPLGQKAKKTKVTVLAWDVGHNPLGRAYLLADVLRHDYDVELIGASFPRFGNEVWEPLRDGSRVLVRSFSGGNFPEHFTYMDDIAKQIEGDVIYVSKPRLPSLELALLATSYRNRPVLLDVDDYELGFFENRAPLTLAALKESRLKADFNCPHDETWTRYAASLIPLFEQVTVSNEELRKKFGGTIVPHIRDEHDFDPLAYPRETVRAELGFVPADKVVLFAGTPRSHKGLERVVSAVEKLNHPHYKLLVVGAPADAASQYLFSSLNSERVKCVGNVSFRDLPGYLCAGDLICLLQREDTTTARFQMPAKFTDALAMRIPILATNVPPLINLAEEGLVELLGSMPLDEKIHEIFEHYEVYKHKAGQNRKIFLEQYSYGANRPRLKRLIDAPPKTSTSIPETFSELIAYHREIFSSKKNVPRTTATVVAGPSSRSCSALAPVRPAAVRRREARSYVDDKIDIVFFWKQNDTGIYGRRQDMLVKYLAKDPRVQRIFHFDAPINLLQSGAIVVQSSQKGRHSHAQLVLLQTLARKLRLKNEGKVQYDTFVTLRRKYPQSKYLDYLTRKMNSHEIGQRKTIFWVCPNNFDFPLIGNSLRPDLIVADVIDDQRTWPCSPQYREKLHRNYQEILAQSDLTFVNCRSVFDSMQPFTDNIHLLPNAAEFLEEESRSWNKPRALKRLTGPVIGYVGNLDVARIDLDLLATLAAERPQWNLVFIGSMHRGRDIFKLSKFRNVHFLGVRPYDQAIRYIRHFDVAIIPHLHNELTRNMNPLKLYVYFSLHVPVVSTPIANVEDFAEFIQIGHTPREFIERISYCLDKDTVSGAVERIRDLLEANSWDKRVARILALIDTEFTKLEQRRSPQRPAGPAEDEDGYTARCTVCGHTGRLCKQERAMRESYRCEACQASLRYREQARLILKHFSKEGSGHLAELVRESDFQNLRIYEPGRVGPFRKFFRKLPGYRDSYFWEDVQPGTFREGMQCQDLMNLTYEDDSFDLVLSSDIFEHVRKPFVGFREVNRVLKPGGFHIFTIPLERPMPSATVFRVDASGPQDVFVLPKEYHSEPMGGKSLVYTDFGEDMSEIMSAAGIDLKMESPCAEDVPAVIRKRMLSFYWQKEFSPNNMDGILCNICGSSQFKEGVFGRKSSTGKLPACVKCGSLERHRVARRVWNCIPIENLRFKRVLQFSLDPSVEEKWFRSFEVSIYGHRNSLDLQKLDRADGSYDIVICNHILEHVEKDCQAFRELVRILEPDGFLQFSVPNPKWCAETEDWGYPKPEVHNHYRRYGRDVCRRFGDARPGVHLLEVDATDDVTGVSDFVYFASLDGTLMNEMRPWFDKLGLSTTINVR